MKFIVKDKAIRKSRAKDNPEGLYNNYDEYANDIKGKFYITGEEK